MKHRSLIADLSSHCGENIVPIHEQGEYELTYLDALTDTRDYLQSYLSRIDEFIGEIDDDEYLLSKTYSANLLLSSPDRDDLNYYLSDVSEALIQLGRKVEQKIAELDEALKNAG